jgi:transposase
MRSITDYCCFVGLDYHDSFVQVCILDADGRLIGNSRVENRISAILEYVDHTRNGLLIKAVAVEACCGASKLTEELLAHEWPIKLAHAGICEKMKRSPDKTDYTDARMLADLCRVGYLPQVWLPPKEIRDLRRLTRFRQQQVEQRRDIKLRIRALLRDERVVPPSDSHRVWTKAWFKWLAETDQLSGHSRWVMDSHLEDLERVQLKIKQIEARMEEASAQDEIVQQLRKTKGIGLVTAVTMRAEIGDIERFSCGKQLARYCAVTPKNVSSGKRIADGGLIKAGSLALRTVIIEAAQRLARYDGKWRELKQQLVARGKKPSVAVAAVANRWVRKLYWELIDQQEKTQAA